MQCVCSFPKILLPKHPQTMMREKSSGVQKFSLRCPPAVVRNCHASKILHSFSGNIRLTGRPLGSNFPRCFFWAELCFQWSGIGKTENQKNPFWCGSVEWDGECSRNPRNWALFLLASGRTVRFGIGVQKGV